MYRKRYKRFALAALAAGLMMGAAFVGEANLAWAASTVTSTISLGASPRTVAYDAGNGDVYVANYGSNTVTVINGSTNTVTGTLTVGKGPEGVAYDAGNGDVYVTNGGDNTVSVINGSTNTVTGTISVGMDPYGVAVDEANGDVYIANVADNTVSVINGSTNQLASTIKVNSEPIAVAYDAVNGDVYVTNLGSNTVTVINGSTNAVTDTISVGRGTWGVAYDAANGDVYVANSTDNTVSVISGSTNTVTDTISVGNGPEGVAYDAANGDVYVANVAANTVSVINGSTNTVTGTFMVGREPIAVAYNAATGDVYVANYGSNSVTVINGSAHTVADTISVGRGTWGVAYDAANGDVYVANSADNTVSVVNGSTNTVTGTLTVGNGPEGVAYDATNGNVYVANVAANTVSVINGSSNAVTSTFTVGREPIAVAYNAANGDVYVANYGSNTMSVINGSTSTVTSTISLGASPRAVAYDAGNGDVYVANYGSNTVTVINGNTNTVTGTLTVGKGPEGVAYDAGNGDVYVTNGGDNTVSVINGSSNTVTGTISVGMDPYGVAVDEANGDVYIANVVDNTVSVINGSTNQLASTIKVTSEPIAVAYDAVNGDVYVSNLGSDTVYVIVPPMPAITSSSVVPGSTVDTTAITTTPDTAGDNFAIQVTSTPPSALGPGGSLPGASTAYKSGTNISRVAVGDVVTLYEITSGGTVDAATSFTLTKSEILGATITYDGNGASGTAPTDGRQYIVGESATVASQGSLTKAGYAFSGWDTEADGSGTRYNGGSTLTIGTSNITLYAQWTANPTAVPSGLGHSDVTPTDWTETWSPVSGASAYDVYLNGNQVGSTTQKVYSYNFTKEQPGTTYNVQVSSVNAAGQQSSLSATDSVTTAVYGSRGPVPPFINTIFFMDNATVGTPYSAQIMTTGGKQPFQWSITSGSLPQGLTLNNQGIISGTPTGLGGQYTFTVQVMDANNLVATRQLNLRVFGPTSYPTVTSTTLSSDTIGQPYDQTLAATGGTAPYTWSVVKGALPAGLSLNAQTGELSGTPTKGGISSVTAQAMDATGMTATQTLTVDVLQANQREIDWNGQIRNVPAVVGNDSGTQTTYMPIWYVMQLLKSVGIQSAWNGHDWNLTTSTAPDLTDIQTGTGDTSIYLNGTLVQQVNTEAQIDPSTGKATTYMPIWYVEQILNRVGLKSMWDGTTWTVAQANS